MKPTRRSAISLAIVGLASRSLQAQEAPKDFAITTGPYLQSPAADSMTVMWISSHNSTSSVEYGEVDGPLRTAISSHHGLIDCDTRLHKMVLRGLKPGTVYRYRVTSRQILKFAAYKVEFGETVHSDFREFRTFDPRKRDFSFLVLNDMHDIPSTFAEMLKVAGSRPYDFVLLNGDTIAEMSEEGHLAVMLDGAVGSFASTIPLIWVRGNHETRGRLARDFPSYVDLPEGRHFRSFDQGAVHFTILDSGEDKVDQSPEYSGLVDFAQYRREQAEWLASEVETEAFQRAKYRVVFSHMPFPSAGTGQGDFRGMEDCFERFGAILNNAGISMMISGHIHSPAIIQAEEDRHNYPIVRGGGPKGDRRTIIRVDATDRMLEATVLRPDGSVFGSCRVQPGKI